MNNGSIGTIGGNKADQAGRREAMRQDLERCRQQLEEIAQAEAWLRDNPFNPDDMSREFISRRAEALCLVQSKETVSESIAALESELRPRPRRYAW